MPIFTSSKDRRRPFITTSDHKINESISLHHWLVCYKIPFLKLLVSLALTMASEPHHPIIPAGDNKAYIEYALDQARLSPPASTKLYVGAVLVDADASKNAILSTGYSPELPQDSLCDLGSTHTELYCSIKVAQKYHLPEECIPEVLPRNIILYRLWSPATSD